MGANLRRRARRGLRVRDRPGGALLHGHVLRLLLPRAHRAPRRPGGDRADRHCSHDRRAARRRLRLARGPRGAAAAAVRGGGCRGAPLFPAVRGAARSRESGARSGARGLADRRAGATRRLLAAVRSARARAPRRALLRCREGRARACRPRACDDRARRSRAGAARSRAGGGRRARRRDARQSRWARTRSWRSRARRAARSKLQATPRRRIPSMSIARSWSRSWSPCLRSRPRPLARTRRCSPSSFPRASATPRCRFRRTSAMAGSAACCRRSLSRSSPRPATYLPVSGIPSASRCCAWSSGSLAIPETRDRPMA